MAEWFTSDEHFGHGAIIAFERRPWPSIEAMEDGLVNRHNALVRDGDTVWHVGDFSLDNRIVPRILKRLRGRHVLVAGNHDKCHVCHRRNAREARRYAEWFTEVHTGAKPIEHPRGFLLNHLPYAPRQGTEPAAATPEASHELRYLELRPPDEGRWLVHGHVHSAWKQKRRMINVGVDVSGYRPVALEEVLAFVRAGDAAEECFA